MRIRPKFDQFFKNTQIRPKGLVKDLEPNRFWKQTSFTIWLRKGQVPNPVWKYRCKIGTNVGTKHTAWIFPRNALEFVTTTTKVIGHPWTYLP